MTDAEILGRWRLCDAYEAKGSPRRSGGWYGLVRQGVESAPESSSRQDTRIALLMRAEGHSREAVMNAIRHYGPEWRGEEKRDWQRYAARTASYAFGLVGDMELAHMPRMEAKPVEPPPPPKQSEDEAQWEMPRLRLR